VDKVACLRRVSIFSRLDDAAMAKLTEISTDFDAPAGQTLIEANAPGSGMFVLDSGTVIVEAHERTAELGPGEYFGELALLTDEGLRTARVRAKTDVRCLAISREDFSDLLRAEPTLAVEILEAVATQHAGHLAT
jgi:CRP-like cAMP-binding protein